MEAVLIDERDFDSDYGLDPEPRYRVDLWHGSTSVENYLITGAQSVLEVLAWADREAGRERTYVVYVASGGMMVKLVGHDPTGHLSAP